VLKTGALDLMKSIPAQYSALVLTAYADALDIAYVVVRHWRALQSLEYLE
jgi:hypothetical protein